MCRKPRKGDGRPAWMNKELMSRRIQETTGWLASPHSMQQIILESISKHLMNKKVIRDSLHVFKEGKSCQSKLDSFLQ